MATEKQEYSQIGLTKKRSSQTFDEFCSLVPPTTFRSLGPPSFTGEVIIIDDDDDDYDYNYEKETLKAKEKKPKLGSWWDDVDGLNELSSVTKGLPKSKDAASIVDSSFSSTNLRETRKKEKDERSLSSSHHNNFIDLCKDKRYFDSYHKGNQNRMRYGHMSLVNLGLPVEDPWLGSYIRPPLVSSFASPSTYLLKRETNTKKDDERSLQSSHHDNFIDLSEDEILGESSSSTSNKGNRHVSLAELGVSVEDLKSMPREAFDPTWEIRSETMDPWLGGYIKDMLSPHH